jgi:hypothetical protein
VRHGRDRRDYTAAISNRPKLGTVGWVDLNVPDVDAGDAQG